MPVDYKALAKFETSDVALRLIFTIPEGDDELPRPHYDHFNRILDKRNGEFDREAEVEKMATMMRKQRVDWQDRISSRIVAGRLHNFQNYRWHYAADLAWDGPLFADQIPLTLFAQGRIDVKGAAQQLKDTLGKEKAKDYIEFDDKEGVKPIGINGARLGQKVINLVRPSVTRRKAALSNKFNDLYPWLNYEPRSRTLSGKIRAEITTQRIEQVVDSRGMRHDFTQWVHKMLLHAGQMVFVREPWEVEKAYRLNKSGNPESYVVSEGPLLAHPHPTRTFFDRAHAPSQINFDKGITYCGYWDLVRHGDVKGNPSYFNTNDVKYSTDHEAEYKDHGSYFQAYSPEGADKLKFVPTRTDATNPMANDRQAKATGKTGHFGDNDDDCQVFFTHYYEKVRPIDVGCGTYPYPVWVKLTMINDETVVRARILPSRPAFYMGHNEDDTRDQNISMVHEIMPFQDQAQELLGQLYYLIRLEQMLLLAIDTDLIPDPTMRQHLKDYLQGNRSNPNAFYMEWSGTKIREVQKSQAKSPFEFISSNVQSQIEASLKGIGTTMDLLDKILMMSPQEQGQFITKETNATEVTSVNNTTNALYSFISEGPDEARAALKQILYESMMACGEDEIPTAVVAQFPKDAILKAGFEFIADGDEGSEPEAFIVKGLKKQMAHDFVFNSRDGSERTVSVEGGKTLYQFVTQILSNQMLLQLFGWKQVADMISEVFRLSGSSFAIKLPANLPEGGPVKAQGTEVEAAMQGFQQEFQKALGDIQGQIDGNTQSDAEIKERMGNIEGVLKGALDELTRAAEVAQK